MPILPSVIVPVLSEQSTFMLPKFSIAARRFTITFSWAMRRAPCERLIVMIAGSSCGVSPTASASANKNESNTGLCRKTLNPKIASTSKSVTSASKKPKRRTPRSNSVSGRRNRKLSAIFPNRVSRPVEMISALPEPLTTCVPRNTSFFGVGR